MNTRSERRAEWKKVKQKLKNPLVRRILKDEMERGSGTEVYRLDDGGNGKPLFLNISKMKTWAKENCEVFAMPVDMDRADRLVKSGAVGEDHIFDHTIKTDLTPIIVCQGMSAGDQIVDGAHRFVAMCLGSTIFGLEVSIPGYVLSHNEWKQFVIPNTVANQCGFF